ncbi:MAG TPA: FkbM family methyltransferase, partial [Isosphaeraceae bacterium]|nr:FkbM family methyltransferase [Isosphaeraceae bacterium]
DIILDIGVHIGTFSYQALRRGSSNVYGFEANRSNYECAVHNLQSFGDRVHLYHRAVWRSDDKTVETLYFTPSPDTPNTGGGNVVWGNEGPAVKTIALDDVIRDVTRGGKKRIRMIKIDCEGSEFSILMTSKLLHLVDVIAGEYHEFGGEYDKNLIPERAKVSGFERFTIVELTDFLQRAGFQVTSERHPNTNLGLFHAVNQGNRVPRPAFLKTRIRSAWQGLRRKLSSS